MIHIAARNGDVVLALLLLLQNVALVNLIDGEQQTPLHVATIGGHYEFVRLMMENGANINAVDEKGRTALHYAAMGGHAEIVLLLLLRGTLVDPRDKRAKMTPLHWAVDNDCLPIVEFLLAHKADKTLTDKKGKTALDLASDSDVIQLLTDEVRQEFL